MTSPFDKRPIRPPKCIKCVNCGADLDLYDYTEAIPAYDNKIRTECPLCTHKSVRCLASGRAERNMVIQVKCLHTDYGIPGPFNFLRKDSWGDSVGGAA